MREYECGCGYVWIDDNGISCPLCGNRYDIVYRPYEIQQPDTFAIPKQQKTKVKKGFSLLRK